MHSSFVIECFTKVKAVFLNKESEKDTKSTFTLERRQENVCGNVTWISKSWKSILYTSRLVPPILANQDLTHRQSSKHQLKSVEWIYYGCQENYQSYRDIQRMVAQWPKAAMKFTLPSSNLKPLLIECVNIMYGSVSTKKYSRDKRGSSETRCVC